MRDQNELNGYRTISSGVTAPVMEPGGTSRKVASVSFRLPIDYRTEPHPLTYVPLRDLQSQRPVADENGKAIPDLDSPIIKWAECGDCGESVETRFYPDPERAGRPYGNPCIACVRAWWEELTSPQVPGSKGKDDAWKSANLHLYYEHYYEKRCKAASTPAIIRRFSIQELLRTYGSGGNRCYVDTCAKRWRDITYLTPPEDYGTHSLENVRPACLDHARESSL